MTSRTVARILCPVNKIETKIDIYYKLQVVQAEKAEEGISLYTYVHNINNINK